LVLFSSTCGKGPRGGSIRKVKLKEKVGGKGDNFSRKGLLMGLLKKKKRRIQPKPQRGKGQDRDKLLAHCPNS